VKRHGPEELEDDGGPLFAARPPPHNGTRTSIAAADSVRSKAARQRDEVFACILSRPGGVTREEIQEALGLDGNSVRPRVWELLGNGGHAQRIRETGELRQGKSGRSMEVLVAAFG
jgi:hypothetical protein